MFSSSRRPTDRTCRPLWLLCLVAALPLQAGAWSLTINGAGRRVYLHVGNGTFDGANATINQVSVTVPPQLVGQNVPLTMGTNSTQGSSLSGVTAQVVCPSPASQVHIGASYRRNGNSNLGDATLSVNAPAVLTNARGETIPIGQISWTASAPGSPLPEVIPSGSFSGGTQFLAPVPMNRYIETCHTFRYANSVVPAEGTYTAQVTYTLSSP